MGRTLILALLAVLALGFGLREAGRLRALRREEASLALTTPPRLQIDPTRALFARDDAAAAELLERLIADAASARGVRAATQPGAPSPAPGFVARDLVATAPEAVLRDYAAALEDGRPTVRFARWTLAPGGGGVVLHARAIAAWRAR